MGDNGYWKGQTDAKVESLEERVHRIDANVTAIRDALTGVQIKVAGIAGAVALITSLIVALYNR